MLSPSAMAYMYCSREGVEVGGGGGDIGGVTFEKNTETVVGGVKIEDSVYIDI